MTDHQPNSTSSDFFVDPENMTPFSEWDKGEKPYVESKPLGAPTAPSPNVELMPTVAPLPYLRRGKPAQRFRALKTVCINGAGFDFLSVVGDMMRHKNFQSNKPGVASRSRHKCGQAFDYNQEDRRLIVVSEPMDGRQYFRTWLKCAKQDGSQGVKKVLKDIRGPQVSVWAWDFTAAAEGLGWKRIPAWSGWQTSYTKKEFWHYELTEGTTYDEAMQFLYGPFPLPVEEEPIILDTSSKGPKLEALVKEAQQKLIILGYLKQGDADGKFGPKTKQAVERLQQANGLLVDGRIGPFTMNKINMLVKETKQMSDEFDYNTDDVNATVIAAEDDNIIPDPWYQTSQFKILIATYILGPLAVVLANKGWITPEQAPILTGIFQTVVVAFIGWITQQFMKTRGEVTVVKAKAAAALTLAGGDRKAALQAFRGV